MACVSVHGLSAAGLEFPSKEGDSLCRKLLSPQGSLIHKSGNVFVYTQVSYTNGNLCVWRTAYATGGFSTQPCRAGEQLLAIKFADTNGVGLIVGKSVFSFLCVLLSMNGINRKLVQFYVAFLGFSFYLINKLISSFDIIMTE